MMSGLSDIFTFKIFVGLFAVSAFVYCVIKACYVLFSSSNKKDDPWNINNAVKSLRTATKAEYTTREIDKEGNPIIKTSEIDPDETVRLVLKTRIISAGILLTFATVFLIMPLPQNMWLKAVKN